MKKLISFSLFVVIILLALAAKSVRAQSHVKPGACECKMKA